MEPEGMVHALEEIHRLLKPTGVLIDIHPVEEAMLVEIHQGEKIDLVGHWSVEQWCTDYRHADNALAEVLKRGQFAVEREQVFDSLTYYSSAIEMRTDLEGSVAKYARDDQSSGEELRDIEALAARAGEMIGDDHTGVELVMHERAHISRLKPI